MKFNLPCFITTASVILFLISPTASYAQFGDNEIDFNPGVNDEQAASINGVIALGLLIGGYLGIRTLRK
jgi:hypothetical protein